MHYLCYFFERDDATGSWCDLTSQTEDEAHDHALGLLVGHPRAERVEVWDKSRLTFSYNRSEAKTPADLRRLCYLAIAASEKEDNPTIRRTIASRAFSLAQEAEALERQARSDPEKAAHSSTGGSRLVKTPQHARSRPVDSDEVPLTGFEPLSVPCIIKGQDGTGRELVIFCQNADEARQVYCDLHRRRCLDIEVEDAQQR